LSARRHPSRRTLSQPCLRFLVVRLKVLVRVSDGSVKVVQYLLLVDWVVDQAAESVEGTWRPNTGSMKRGHNMYGVSHVSLYLVPILIIYLTHTSSIPCSWALSCSLPELYLLLYLLLDIMSCQIVPPVPRTPSAQCIPLHAATSAVMLNASGARYSLRGWLCAMT